MTAKLPPEVHAVHGTKGENQGILLPEKVRARIPEAEWMDNPNDWSKAQFVQQTSDYLYQVYGIGSEQDRHVLAMLADQIDSYVDCNRHIAVEGLVSHYNDGKTLGPSPYVAIRKETLKQIIVLMNELGLTPKGRLKRMDTVETTDIGQFMLGPQIKK